MNKGIKRLLIVFAITAVGIGALVWYISTINTMYSGYLDRFVALYERDREEGLAHFEKKLHELPAFREWCDRRLAGMEATKDWLNAAAHVTVLVNGFEFDSKPALWKKALRYRYENSLNVLQATDNMSARFWLDFRGVTTYNRKDREMLFWFSFFSPKAMARYYELFGFEDYQALLRALLQYPYARENSMAASGNPCRDIAVFCITEKSLRTLVKGVNELPFGLVCRDDSPFEPPIELEDELGWDPAIDWHIRGMEHTPSTYLNHMRSLLEINSQRSRDILLDAIEKGIVTPKNGKSLLEPAYKQGIELPEQFIEEGLRSKDERERVFAMMHSLLQPGTERVKWVREMIVRPGVEGKYLLIHRLEPEDLDSGSIQHLRKIFIANLEAEWVVSKLEAFVIAAKIYEIFGRTGLLDLVNREMFTSYSPRISELITLFGGPEEVASYEGFVNWVSSIKGAPLWWIISADLFPSELEPEFVHGAALAAYFDSYEPGSSAVPPPHWRALFALDATDPRPRYRKDVFIPFHMFGFSKLENPRKYLSRAFWLSDTATVKQYFSSQKRLYDFHESFAPSLEQDDI
ncbi:MAG: hypothetical protein U5N86_09925 [Planctomycetota bacterium]|nr:hypothetical protein [Planctomycetota bacterium]